MMHPLDEFLSVVGTLLAFLGITCGLLCSQPWVMWVAGVGLALMLVGLGLDKLREMKREANEYRWW